MGLQAHGSSDILPRHFVGGEGSDETSRDVVVHNPHTVFHHTSARAAGRDLLRISRISTGSFAAISNSCSVAVTL